MSGRDLHARLLTLDAHLDTPLHFARAGWDFGERHDLRDDIAQVDLPRMEGCLSGGFFVVFTEQGPLTPAGYAAALESALGCSARIDATVAAFEDRIGLALTSEDARRLHGEGRRIAFKSIENSYPLGENLDLLADFHAQGVRMAGPVHARTNQLADSATDAARWDGLSPLGRRWVVEMNLLGMTIDASHASDAAFDQMLALSQTPVLCSHSGARAVHDHPRNLDDARIRALADNGGAIGFTAIFLSDMSADAERLALFRQHGRIATLAPEAQREFAQRWHALDRAEPMWAAQFDDYMAALLHVIHVAGVDHVCFGADFDGGGGLPDLADVTAFPLITERLCAAGYTETAIAKMWGGNILRILDAVQAHAAAAR